jgi:DNA-directed RNA polymerase specialized sigma24 family protein
MCETTPDHDTRLAADAAIRQLYGQHESALRGYVLRYCADRAAADDIVQETFIRGLAPPAAAERG